MPERSIHTHTLNEEKLFLSCCFVFLRSAPLRVLVARRRSNYLSVPRAFKLDYWKKRKNKLRTRAAENYFFFRVCVCEWVCLAAAAIPFYSNSYSSTCSLTLNTYHAALQLAYDEVNIVFWMDSSITVFVIFFVVVDCRWCGRRRHRLTPFTLCFVFLFTSTFFPQLNSTLDLFILFFYAFFVVLFGNNYASEPRIIFPHILWYILVGISLFTIYTASVRKTEICCDENRIEPFYWRKCVHMRIYLSRAFLPNSYISHLIPLK